MVYDGATMPFRMFKPANAGAKVTILDVDVDRVDGSIYACGWTSGEPLWLGSFNVSTLLGTPRGFVFKMNKMGVVQWVNAMIQSGIGKESYIGCKQFALPSLSRCLRTLTETF